MGRNGRGQAVREKHVPLWERTMWVICGSSFNQVPLSLRAVPDRSALVWLESKNGTGGVHTAASGFSCSAVVLNLITL